MKNNTPLTYLWFSKLGLTKFISWHFETGLDENHFANKQFEKETNGKRKLLTFARRQDMDTFAAFEIINGQAKENIVVFHPSFGTNTKGWNIIQAEYPDFFSFMKKCVLVDMEDWIKNDDVEDYI